MRRYIDILKDIHKTLSSLIKITSIYWTLMCQSCLRALHFQTPLILTTIFPNIRVFSNESALCIRWLKFWLFSFNISPSNEHLGLISFRMDWLDLLAVQVTLKRVFSKTTLQKHQFFCAQVFLQSNSHIHTLC